MVIIYTTCKNTDEAKKLGRMIVGRHLASCVNMWPIESIYFGKEDLIEGAETALLIKTHEPKIADIEELILKNHAYAVPFIGSVEVKRLNREYKEWMSAVIK